MLPKCNWLNQFYKELYWCQIIVLPKKVIKEIQIICRNFLWTGLDANSRKARVAWDTICL